MSMPGCSHQVEELRSQRRSCARRVSMTTKLQLSIIIITFGVDHSPGPFLGREEAALNSSGKQGTLII